MDLQQVDKTLLKHLIKEILQEDLSLFKKALQELLAEKGIDLAAASEERRKRIEQMVQEDFDTYEEVFKALA